MRKRIIKVIIGVVVVIGLGFAGIFAVIFASMQPTEGARIPGYENPQTALLVVDIQEDFTGVHAKKPYKDGPRIVAVANELLARDYRVVYIQNVVDNAFFRFLAGGLNAPGASGTEMDHRLLRVSGAPTMTKNRADAFSNPELDEYLRSLRVNHVIIIGLDAAYCINATLQGALNRGYKVTVATRGIATESGKSLSDLTRAWQKLGIDVVDLPVI
jgi:nicotinamidase-related amidase